MYERRRTFQPPAGTESLPSALFGQNDPPVSFPLPMPGKPVMAADPPPPALQPIHRYWVGRASFARRLGAFTIDHLLVIGWFLPPLLAILGIGWVSTDYVWSVCTDSGGHQYQCEIVSDATLSTWLLLGAIAVIIFLAISYLIQVRPLVSTGQTAGRRTMKIRVVKAATGECLSTRAALGRWVFGLFAMFQVFVLGHLWMLWDRNRQTLHDKAVRAIVVPADGDANTWMAATPPPPSQALPPRPFVSDPLTDSPSSSAWPGEKREWSRPAPRFTATAETGLDLTSMPPALAELARWLVTKGFTVTNAHVWGPDHQSGEFRFEDRQVNIDGSNGQWTIMVGTSRMSSGFHPDQWAAWVNGSTELEPTPSSIDEQARFIMERWSRALRRLGDVTEAEAELEALGQTGFAPGHTSTEG
ncbi:MAG: RDD family protein [Actinomycetia bacterium]|nr:RDD family protein [Actinomycetes bacterium]MCP5035421.1 RDD family protein [Actinomycetes bacterium]